jgi:DNA-binding LytR/AlgR family response regulator
VRISRFNIVQIDRIKELELFDSGDCRLTLHTGTRLTLSRRYRANLRRRGLL